MFSVFLFTGTSYGVTADDTVIESYQGSTDLPDALAYRAFVTDVAIHSKLKSTAVDYLGFLLGLPDTPADRMMAEHALNVLVVSYEAMDMESIASQTKNFCVGPEAAVWTRDEYFQVMDTQDVLNELIAERHYHLAIKKLGPQLAEKLNAALQREKTAISLTRIDHKAAWERVDPQKNPAEILAEICERLGSMNGKTPIVTTSRDGVTETYHGSPEMPTELAYDVFLGMVGAMYDEPESSYRYVAKAVGKDIITEEGKTQAVAFTNQFRDAYYQVQAQLALEQENTLCTEDRATRTFDEAVEALDAVSTSRRQILNDNLQLALDSLDEEETSAFLESLVQTKLSTAYTSLDTRTYYETDPKVDIWETIEMTCDDPLPYISYEMDNEQK